MAAHPDVDKVAFTGSHLTGQQIVQTSAGNLKRMSLELGGKSPDIVFADADLEAAVPGAGMAVFANSGQICSAGTRLFVEKAVYEEFTGRVAEFSRTLRVGDGRDPEVEVGPLVSAEGAAAPRAEGVNTLEFRATTQNFSPAILELDTALRSGRLRHDGDPVLK